MEKKADLNQREPMLPPFESPKDKDKPELPYWDDRRGNPDFGRYPDYGRFPDYGRYPDYGRFPDYGRYPWRRYPWYGYPWHGYPWYGRGGRGPWWYGNQPGIGEQNLEEGDLEQDNEGETDIFGGFFGFPWYGYPWYGFPWYSPFYGYPYHRRYRRFYF